MVKVDHMGERDEDNAKPFYQIDIVNALIYRAL